MLDLMAMRSAAVQPSPPLHTQQPTTHAWIPVQVDKTVLAGNRNAETGEVIPAAEPGTEGSYLYLDT